jgi:coenzyme F420 biosynthesis associated uncharacterized protein
METTTVAQSVEPVDWALARRVARIVGGNEPLGDSYLADSLRDDFSAVTTEAEQLVSEHTGLRPLDPARATVVDRSAWVDANIESMRSLLAPVLERVGARMAASHLAPVGRRVAATETGFLLGYLSQRVLGQYDLLVPDEQGDAVYYVGANVLRLEKRFGFRPRSFRLWIALHELTHRAQFTGVPWLRPYFLSSVRELVDATDLDPRRFVSGLLRAVDELRRGRDPLDVGIVGLVATAEQRRVLERIQALMALLEGHGNAVMNSVGAEVVDGQDRMARVLESRRAKGGMTGLLHRLLGLDLKIRQYRLGESFVATVERDAGRDALAVVWRGPEWLPTLDELDHPDRWISRVDAGAPTDR